MLVLSAIWFLGVYPCLNAFYWTKPPKPPRMESSDFGQYYGGALAARFGLWQYLYPTPKKGIYDRPPEFKPTIQLPFLDKNGWEGRWFLYPQIASSSASDIAPQVLEHCPQLDSDWRFILPPPTALYLSPLGFFDHRTASNIWFALMGFSLFGIGVLSQKMYRLLSGKITFTEGWICILPAIPTWLRSNMLAVEIGNISPLLGLLIAWTAYAWMRNRQLQLASSLILLMPFKGIGTGFCPLFFVPPIKWKTLIGIMVLGVVVNLATLYIGGVGPYRVFFTEILPKAYIPAGFGLQRFLVSTFGIDVQPFFALLNLCLACAFYFGFWRKRKAPEAELPAIIVALNAGMIALFCILNPIVWPHYCTNCLLLPFAGWIFWEAFQSKGIWKVCLWTIIALHPLMYLDAIFCPKDAVVLEWLKAHGLNAYLAKGIRILVITLCLWIIPFTAPLLAAAVAFKRVLGRNIAADQLS